MKIAVLGGVKEIEEQVEKDKQVTLVVINNDDESSKVFKAAVQIANEAHGKIILIAMINDDIKLAFEFNSYVLNEKINTDPGYVYKTIFA